MQETIAFTQNILCTRGFYIFQHNCFDRVAPRPDVSPIDVPCTFSKLNI